MIRLRKAGILLLSLLLAGCTQSGSAAAVPTASPTPVPTPLTADFHTVQEQAEKAGKLVASRNWEELSALFAEDAQQAHSPQDLEELISSHGSELSYVSAVSSILDGINSGYALMQGSDGMYQLLIRVNEELGIERLVLEKKPEIPEAEESGNWKEVPLEVGNEPKLAGLLTLPKEQDYPYVAVLMGEGLEDGMNASGTDPDFRRDLAHALAEEGIASIRYDMRLYKDPSCVLDPMEETLDRIYWRDFASAVHMLEQYPVDAQHIFYIGHGISGSLGYSAVYHHFEITKGLVLLNAPFGSGEELMAHYYGLSEDTADEAEEILASEKSQQEETESIGGYPSAWWKDWKSSQPLRYTRYVSMPIAIFQGENDTSVTEEEDYENWKSQKGSNVDMVVYEDAGHDLRDEDGSLETLATDISSWLDGKDLEQIVKKRDAAKARRSASRRKNS